MGLFSRFTQRRSSSGQRAAKTATEEHLTEFVQSREGVEAYFEPETPREQCAILLVAHDGEWTRRRVPDLSAAAKLAARLDLPLYEINRTGYPTAMREWNRKHPGSALR